MENLNEILEAAKAKSYITQVYTERQTDRPTTQVGFSTDGNVYYWFESFDGINGYAFFYKRYNAAASYRKCSRQLKHKLTAIDLLK
tara:strand:- start:229 stop:486 length:258 start_codon:yes stop_codon:yes gene_type:complete